MNGDIIVLIIWCSIVFSALGLMVWDEIKANKRRKKLPKYEICKSYDVVNDKTKYVVWQYRMHVHEWKDEIWKDEIFSSDTLKEAEEVVKRIIENENEIITNKIISQYYEKHFSE